MNALKHFFALYVTLIALTAHGNAEDLRWGADVESGAPFSFNNPQNPGEIIGFESEMMTEIAKRLNKNSVFVQNSWDGLIEGLERKNYDLVVNGLEITPDRAQKVLFSKPYLITTQTLAVHKDTYLINSIDDLQQKKVGTLDGSLAHRILKSLTFPLEIATYDEEVLAYNDLANGRLQAILLDEPIYLYYGKPNKNIKRTGPPIGYMEYGIAFRKSDATLLNEVNSALGSMIADGSMRSILEKWGLWNEITARAWGQEATPREEAIHYEEFLKFNGQELGFYDIALRYLSFLPLLAKGAVMTLKISIVAMILAIIVGLMIALLRLYGPKPLSFLALSFVEIFRGTPLLIQLYLIFYGLPHVGIRLNPFSAAVIGLGLNYGACEAENYRAGILSVPKAQMDASQALGMTQFQALRHVIIPQAMRLVIPPVTNDFIALLKDSSLVSVITMVELTTIYGQLASTYFDYLGVGLLAASVYFIIGLPFVRLSRYFESQLSQKKLRKVKT